MAAGNFDFVRMVVNVKSCISKRTSDTDTVDVGYVFSEYQGSDSEKKSAVDQAFREVLIALLSDNPQENGDHSSAILPDPSNIDQELVMPVRKRQSLISFSIACAEAKYCTHSLPILLLADVFDTLTLENCEKMFSYVESGVSTWTSEPFFSTGKNHLLRMCNDLMRRLSKTQDTVFCGRIQLFLAQLFPIEEKSALNLMSNFHTENVTVYKKDPSDFKATEEINEEEEKLHGMENGELSSSASPVDYNLYVKFWSLQDFFRNPPSCYANVGWRIMNSNVNEVLKVFSSHKLEQIQRKRKLANDSDDISLSDIIRQNADIAQRYFAKYLTNEKLMDLQLNDSKFRRYFLVQLLVLFQYLTGSVKFKQANQVLNDAQTHWIKEVTVKIYTLLEETPPDGKGFAQAVQHVLSREENWINWKNEGCPSFAKTSVPVILEEGEEAPEHMEPSKKTRQRRSFGLDFLTQRSKKVNMGSSELTRLWNICPDNLEACKQEHRLNFMPSLSSFFEEAMEQADPGAGIEEQYKVVNDAGFCWRALRLLARRSHHFFTPSPAPFKSVPEYLSSVVDQLAKDMNKQSDSVSKEDTGCSDDTATLEATS